VCLDSRARSKDDRTTRRARRGRSQAPRARDRALLRATERDDDRRRGERETLSPALPSYPVFLGFWSSSLSPPLPRARRPAATAPSAAFWLCRDGWAGDARKRGRGVVERRRTTKPVCSLSFFSPPAAPKHSLRHARSSPLKPNTSLTSRSRPSHPETSKPTTTQQRSLTHTRRRRRARASSGNGSNSDTATTRGASSVWGQGGRALPAMDR
jgi:hypothetical protein